MLIRRSHLPKEYQLSCSHHESFAADVLLTSVNHIRQSYVYFQKSLEVLVERNVY